jgi:hypothetical protein
MPSRLAFALAFAGIVIWLAFNVMRAARQRKVARAGYFDAIAPLFDRIVTRLEPTGFPRVTGHLGPHAFDLQALPDSLTFRKLPALWIMVSLPEPLPVRATLDIMARPTGQEVFSRFASLPISLPCPAFLPDGTVVRTDDAALVPATDLIARYAQIFDDPKVKELLISPKGLRLVLLGDEAERGRYLIFRDAEVGLDPLSPDRLSPHLQSLVALRHDLIAQAKDRP